jgi:hypothetical protein
MGPQHKGALSTVSSESASPPDLVHVAFAEGEKCLRLTSLTSTTKLVETLEQNSRKGPTDAMDTSNVLSMWGSNSYILF